jgi:uncharacterized protein YndB with AHSA1/START domain
MKTARREGVARSDYAQHIAIDAPPERVFVAIATLDGLRGWWTPLVKRVAVMWHSATRGSRSSWQAADCDAGWVHFLGSIIALVERGQGAPFGARCQRP